MEAQRMPLSPLRANEVNNKTNKTNKGLHDGKSPGHGKLAKRVKTPKHAKKNVVNFGLFSPDVAKGEKGGSYFKLTLAQTPGSAKKKKEEHLRNMRAQAMNKAARAEAYGDFKGACDALMEEGSKPENVEALRSLKKRLSVQASLRKDSKGREAEEVCTKLDEVLQTFEGEKAQEEKATKNLMDAFEKEPAGSPATLGSTKQFAAVKASKQQQEELGSSLVATPVRRSCRKDKPKESEEDALQSSGFAFTPNKFMLEEGDQPQESNGDNSPTFEFDPSFQFDNSAGEKGGTNHSTPTFNLGSSDAWDVLEDEEDEETVQVNPEQALYLNTPNFPKLVRQKPDITPRTAIAKVLATLLNNSVKEGATVKAAAQKMPAKTPAWKSPGRTKKRLQGAWNQAAEKQETKSIAKSLLFAQKIDEEDGSIDHSVELTTVASQVISLEAEEALPAQDAEDIASFHSGLTPSAAPKPELVMKSPVKEMIQKFEDVIEENNLAEESVTVPEETTVEAVKEKPRRKSILKKKADTTKVEEEAPKMEKKGSGRRKSVRFSTGTKQTIEEPAEAPKRATRGSKKAVEASAAAPVVTRKSRRLAATSETKSAEKEVQAEESSSSGGYTKETIMAWRVVDLRAALKKAGLSTTGLKKVLQERALENLL
ncbi:SAP domain-containing protein [Chloropicon primus]|nr:SAP domain-containing protein [Chloropicon primus]